jgi:hypothetical protein
VKVLVFLALKKTTEKSIVNVLSYCRTFSSMVTPCKGFAAKNTLQSVLSENGNLTMSMPLPQMSQSKVFAT